MELSIIISDPDTQLAQFDVYQKQHAEYVHHIIVSKMMMMYYVLNGTLTSLFSIYHMINAVMRICCVVKTTNRLLTLLVTNSDSTFVMLTF